VRQTSRLAAAQAKEAHQDLLRSTQQQRERQQQKIVSAADGSLSNKGLLNSSSIAGSSTGKTTTTTTAAAAAVSSLLRGIPYGLKDLIAVPGYPTSYGLSALRNRTISTVSVIEGRGLAGRVLQALGGSSSSSSTIVTNEGCAYLPWQSCLLLLLE
jgi:Asp-tRNA(Asn)/Glu-tRNA(Gln) amidotransferase A subunit family amidase